MVSSTVSLFSFKVLPVSTISTITSANPISGASSTDPFRVTILWFMLSLSKYQRVETGYFVPTMTKGFDL